MNRIKSHGHHRPALLAMLGMLALVLFTSAVSYGFVWQAEVHERDQYRQMIYDISKAMGENEPCFE